MRSFLKIAPLAVLVACSAKLDLGGNYSDSGVGDTGVAADGWPPGSDAAVTCSVDKCGPTLGIANQKCADGSMSGPTGRCLERTDGTCGWEVRQCPDTLTCQASDCAGMPVPAIACADGPTIPSCVPQGGTCGWTVLCGAADGGPNPPVDAGTLACQRTECGAEPPILPCVDGQAELDCVHSPAGTCNWNYSCVGSADAGSACVCTGPRPMGPSMLCPDGSVAGPTCVLESAGTCGWTMTTCPDAGATDGGEAIDAGPACLPSECQAGVQSCAGGTVCMDVSRSDCASFQCCPALGCAPNCPGGVATDQKGCPTCQCL